MNKIITLIAIFSFGLVFGQACNGLTNITYNGHTYELVEIGGQCWFKENLQTRTYRDGTPIDYPGTNSTLWQIDTTGAYAWYDNDSTTYASTYGALYNWYAVDNSAGLCPSGWHVPSDAEWTVLESYLEANGYNYDGSLTGNKYAKAMADSVGWNSSTATGVVGNIDYPSYRNKSGFSGLPGGIRYFGGGGLYDVIGRFGYWWSSAQSHTYNAWNRYLDYQYIAVNSADNDKGFGFSVRCLKDTGSIQTSLKEEKTFIDINIYPNPFATSATIELSSDPHTLTIYDILGNIVREEKVSGKTIIERGELTTGVYVIEVRSESQKYSGKLVVE
jgi:uncharacterized protein (TIGR02145 family)